jgi:hypothetical protein
MGARRFLVVMAASVSVVVGSAVAVPAFADSGGVSTRQYGHTVSAAEIEAGNAATAKTSRFWAALTTQNGVLRLNASKALAFGIDSETVRQVATGIVAGGGIVTGIAVDAASVARTSGAVVVATAASRARCMGRTNYSVQWFGDQLKLNSCDAARVISAMSAGAGVAGLAAIIASDTGVGGIAGGVIAGVLAIGAGLLGSCAANGTGVIVDVSWAGVPWCVAQ